ncbi:MAG TPA: S41 family peptidase [Treponemataceae bacterium]|nr:S41 family peptidase [Treponemataceae bacterium]
MKIKHTLVTVLLLLMMVSLPACSFLLGGETENTHEALFDSLWHDFNETYALFSVKGIDWNQIYNEYRPRVTNTMSTTAFFAVLGDMLSVLHDGHVYLMTPFDCMNSGGSNEDAEPFSLDLICSSYITGAKTAGEGMFTYGRLASNSRIGYIHIKSFHLGLTGLNQRQDWASDIDSVLSELADTDQIILDVRGNRGGLTGNANTVASRFTSKNTVYAVSRTKSGPGYEDFGPPVELEIKSGGSFQYTKRVILLTNHETMSAGEQFVMAMKTQDNVIQTGSATHGVFSLSLQRTLINGWKYSVSVQRVTDPKGICYEDDGMIPSEDNYCINRREDLENGVDSQFEKAVQLTVVP